MIFTTIACGKCGVEFGVPSWFDRERRENGDGFFCPNGHERVYKDSEVDKLRRERDRLAQRIAERDDEIAKQQKKVKRLEKRAAAGTCPCCNRTFSNMSQHMKKQHPEFVADNVVKLKERKNG